MRYHLIPSLGLSGLALCVGLLASCSSKNDTPQPTPQPKPGPQPAAKNYVLAVNASASGNQSTTLLLKLTDISSRVPSLSPKAYRPMAAPSTSTSMTIATSTASPTARQARRRPSPMPLVLMGR